MGSRQVAMLMDLNKCIGCHTCSVACKRLWTRRDGMEGMWWNTVNTAPGGGTPRGWEEMGGGFHDGVARAGTLPTSAGFGEAWRFDHAGVLGENPEGRALAPEGGDPSWGPNWDEDVGAGEYPNSYFFYLPRICNHCTHPACLEACSRQAIVKRDEDGIVLIEEDRCRGYRFCAEACPYKILDSGEIYFSVETNFYSGALGKEVKRGDLLSDRGFVVRNNESLLARFSPADAKVDYGLRSVYVWPSGEIWFSTETGFTDTRSNLYAPGDLLSDQGYIVYRNLDLLSPFAPIEDVSNFGLDALFIVTDVTPPPQAPLCLKVSVPPGTSDVRLLFRGQGRVFQLEKTSNPAGPWLPLGPIGPDLNFTDAGALQVLPRSFYRLRAWWDTKLSKDFLGIMAQLNAEGKTVLIASHDPLVYESALVDRVVEMRDGRIRESGRAA